MKYHIITDEDRCRSLNAIAYTVEGLEDTLRRGEHNPFTRGVLADQVVRFKECRENLSAAPAHADGPATAAVGLRDLLQEVLDNMFTGIPEPHCSCHISPPCGDCIENGEARDLQKRIKEAIA